MNSYINAIAFYLKINSLGYWKLDCVQLSTKVAGNNWSGSPGKRNKLKEPAGVTVHTILYFFGHVSVGAGRYEEIGQFYGILIMTSRFSDANKSLVLKSGDRSMISLL